MFLDPGLSALAAILRLGSFEAAAAELNLTQSAVSQRVKTLEDRVGTPLIVRGTPCRPTPTGARLFRHAEDLARLDHSVLGELGLEAGPRPPIRIATNADSLSTWLMPALASVGDELFELIVDDQDHSADLLRRGDVAAAITSHGHPVRGADTTALGSLRYIATASPEFRDRWFADGLTARALARAPALQYNEKDALQAAWVRRVTGRSVPLLRHRVPSTTGFLQATLLGLGWGMNPERLVRPHLAEGRLVALDPLRPLETPLYWQVTRIVGDALAPLTRAVRKRAAETLVAPDEGSVDLTRAGLPVPRA